jgi:Sulfite exporter TauE/SafE
MDLTFIEVMPLGDVGNDRSSRLRAPWRIQPPTLGADIKLAGSLSSGGEPVTMLVRTDRYSRDRSFVVLGENTRFVLVMAAGSIVGSFIGAQLLGFVPSAVLLPLLAVILLVSAVKVWRVTAEDPLASPRARPGAILGRSMRRRSPWLRCLRTRRPHDPDYGADLLGCGSVEIAVSAPRRGRA